MALALFFIFFLLWCASLVMIILGLIKPQYVIYWGGLEKKTRLRVFFYYGTFSFVFFIVFIVSLATFGSSLPDPTPEEVAAAQAVQDKIEAKKEAEEKEKAEAKDQMESDKKTEKEAKAETKAKKEAEENTEIDAKAEAKAKIEAEKKAKKEARAEAKAKKEAEKMAKIEAKAEAKAKKEAQKKAQIEAEEAKAKKEEEELVKKKAQAKKEAVEKAAKAEASFKNSAVELNYKQLARDPESFKGEKVLFKGQVMQNMEDGKEVTLLLNVTRDEFGFWDDSILVNYTMSKGEKRILEDDIIYLWATVKGLKTYGSIFGQQITVPEVDGAYLEIIGE
ncbi:hypothetical protein M3193_08015 [Sporosarcina luteola]|uniref:hypothetical protein n=1 Tax=Sporosarcina luteola TaxID=582850 RepID=UPI00203DDF7A|nr:hypothetical protein [Sporosarcina luteola]MCM3744087.1 hypothetical protein [Sporosarcina luteola]